MAYISIYKPLAQRLDCNYGTGPGSLILGMLMILRCCPPAQLASKGWLMQLQNFVHRLPWSLAPRKQRRLCFLTLSWGHWNGHVVVSHYNGLVSFSTWELPSVPLVAATTHLRGYMENMWGAWAVLQKQYGNLRCASSVGLLLRFYGVCVPPTASYGCEVWGLRKLPGVAVRNARDQLQQAHIKILRQIAGARTIVATAILLRELDARPLVHAWWQRAKHFWNNLAESSPQSLHYQIALDDCWDAVVGGVHNWASAIMNGLRQLGYEFTIRANKLDVVDLPRVLQLLQTSQASVWDNLDICPRTCPLERSQYCTYLRWFARPAGLTRPGPLLQQPLSARCLRAFLRFRMGCHDLPKDIGRRRAVPRMQRVCQKCHFNEIGDEKHLIFTCPAVRHVRDRNVALFSASIHTMLDFMWQEDLVGVAKFVMDCFDVITADVGDDRTPNQP